MIEKVTPLKNKRKLMQQFGINSKIYNRETNKQ